LNVHPYITKFSSNLPESLVNGLTVKKIRIGEDPLMGFLGNFMISKYSKKILNNIRSYHFADIANPRSYTIWNQK
jgi:hypothetical protein